MRHGKTIKFEERIHIVMYVAKHDTVYHCDKRINTTLAKAKAQFVELSSPSRRATTHPRRTVFSYLQDKSGENPCAVM